MKVSSLKRQCAPGKFLFFLAFFTLIYSGPYAFNTTTNMSLDGEYYIQRPYRSNVSCYLPITCLKLIIFRAQKLIINWIHV